jgi:hypothetical protein
MKTDLPTERLASRITEHSITEKKKRHDDRSRQALPKTMTSRAEPPLALPWQSRLFYST